MEQELGFKAPSFPSSTSQQKAMVPGLAKT